MSPLSIVTERRTVICAAAALALGALGGGVSAQDRMRDGGADLGGVLRILVGFPAGTAPDTLARLLADGLAPRLGAAVVVENLPGAAGNLAARQAAQAAPDGRTLLLAGNATLTVNRFLYAEMGFDPDTDLRPISRIAATPNVLVVRPGLSVDTPQELAALGRASGGGLIYAHVGLGTSTHLGAESFGRMAGVDLVAAPYQGGAAIYPDLLADRVDMCFCNIAAALPLIRDGRLRGLALSSARPSPSAPELPTMASLGYEGFDAVAWFGLAAPAGVPDPIVETIASAVAATLTDPARTDSFAALGMERLGDGPAAFRAAVDDETRRTGALVHALGIAVR